MARIVLAIVDVLFAVRSVVTGLADTLIAAERVYAVTVLAGTFLALVNVLLTELALEAGRTGTNEAGHPVNAGTIILTLCISKTWFGIWD